MNREQRLLLLSRPPGSEVGAKELPAEPAVKLG
jgi:hypothetical protein